VADAINRGARIGRAPFREGDRVRVCSGKLAGIQGKISIGQQGKLFLNTSFLASVIDLEGAEVEPI